MRTTRTFLMSLLLLGLFSTSAWAQTRRINGRVTALGSTDPIPSATVNVVGTTFGAVTDADGRFSVTAPEGPVTLRVRRIGYAPKNIAVASGLTEVAISLPRDVLELDKQVITGTATTVASVNAPNAVTVLSTDQINRVPAQTLDNALQGKIPGAIVSTNSGAPGGGTQIQLRGVNTINGAFSPIYVVDGVIVNNSAISNGLNVITQASRSGGVANFASSQDQMVNRIADLNPNDIESIQVLKGPSASSIYGSVGANGVIIISTKKGRAGKTTLDMTQRFGTYTLANKLGPFLCFKSADEAADGGWIGGGKDATLFNAATNKCHDYEEEFYGNNKLAYQTVASLRGATSSGTNFFISGLAQHDNGLAPNDFYQKQSLRVNVGHQLGTRLSLQANTEILHSLTQRGVSGNDNTGINPYTTFSQTPSFIDLQRQPDGTFPKNPQRAVGNSNPFQNADLVKTPENVFRLIGSATGSYNILAAERQTLDLTMTGGVDAYNDEAKVISPATAYVEQVNANPGTLVLTNANVVHANLNGTLAHRLITNAFSATTSGGFRQTRREINQVNNIGRGVFPGVTNVGLAVQTFINQAQSTDKVFALFAQEELLALNERLLLTAGINSERSSNNGDASKMNAYPKFAASLRLPEMLPKVNEMKLRLAWGRAGTQPTAGKFTFLTTLFNEGRSGLRASTVKGFSGIKPETATELEGGFDLQAFNGRSRLSFSQWRKTVTDLLLQANTAPSTGFTSQYINGGKIVNNGTEVELGITPIQTDRLEWVSNTTFSRFKGKVTELPVPAFNPGVGSFGSRFGNVFIQKGESPTVIQAVNECAVAVAPRSATAPFGGSCPSASRILHFVGDAMPDFTMGFSNDFTFGPIRLGSLFDWRKGGDVINLTNNYFDSGLLGDTAVGNNRVTAFRGGKAVYVEDAGFVKLRELTLAYQLPAALASRLFNGRAEAARIELSGRNLITWTNYTGLDPEVSNFSNVALGRIQDVTPYPPSRSFFFSINATF
ncbi:MAG: SusC/RagA family TonB-linked outer membrane protein [Gemmatimonadaceae bacterium]|nr:SusC/RagA family TonB-linked outer membrane protein [Gemmatimonadaceae bacterium]